MPGMRSTVTRTPLRGRSSAAAPRRRPGAARGRWPGADGARLVEAARRRSRRRRRWCCRRRCAAHGRRAPAPAADGACADRAAPLAGGGARCSTASASRPGGPAWPAGPGRPSSGTAPAARSSSGRARRRAQRQHAPARPRSRRSTRRPMSPQPTMSSVGGGAGGGGAGMGYRVAAMFTGAHGTGTMAASLRAAIGARQPASPPSSAMSFNITVQPADRTSRSKPTKPCSPPPSARASACPTAAATAPAARASAAAEGRVVHGPHQLKALSVEEEDAGFILTCCAVPQTDCVVEARSVPGAGEFPVLKLPSRVLPSSAGARRGGAAPAAAGQPEPAVPRRPVRRVHPARRRAAQLQHGQRAAQPGQPAGDRTARAPHARRQVHRPCLRRHEGARHPAHGRPLRQLLPARGQRQADRAAGQRHRASRR
jgi:hypothetical protein